MQISKVSIHNFRTIEDATLLLKDYALLIGANNCGKTNIIDSLRVFYEKDNYKFIPERDEPKFKTADPDSWIELWFTLTDQEFSTLKEDYRQSNNGLHVRKYLRSSGKTRAGIYAYVGGEISDEYFYGAANVQKGKLGDLIYIQSASKLDDHTKLSGPSELRDLLNNIVKQIAKTSPAFTSLAQQIEEFSSALETEKTDDGRSLSGLLKDINEGISGWSTEAKLKVNAITDSDLIKNLVSFKTIDKILDAEVEPGQFGQGFQRHLIFTLIQLAARYQSRSVAVSGDTFSPSLTLLLFEEPEAFLHPSQQQALCRSLRDIAGAEGTQVLISSHSPYFASQSSDEILSVIRLCRSEANTVVGQVTPEKLSEIFSSNLKINDLVRGTKYQAQEDDLKEDMEAVKFFLWLDPERCGMFFAGHVILVEGPTERCLLNYLISEKKILPPRGGVFILDCMGKFNMHRFMNLLGALNVGHSVLLDEDNDVQPHPKIKGLIEESRSMSTHAIDSFPADIEEFLGIPPAKSPHRKPQHAMLCVKDGRASPERVSALCDVVQRLIPS